MEKANKITKNRTTWSRGWSYVESRHLYLENGVVDDQVAIFEDPRGHGGEAEQKTQQRADKAHSANCNKAGISQLLIKWSILKESEDGLKCESGHESLFENFFLFPDNVLLAQGRSSSDSGLCLRKICQ